jgi:TRAP transporter TAXI family solute receptor
MITNALLKAYGIPVASVKLLQTIETNEAVEALKTGMADGAIIPAGLRSSTLLGLTQSVDITFLSISEEKMKQILRELGPAFQEAIIPKGTYRGQTEDVRAPALIAVIAVRSDFPEDLAYTITKTILESEKELQAVHFEAKEWNVKNSLRLPPAPLHPGAIRYFKEKGLWSVELEKYNEMLLKTRRM